jgi:Family of unknown function (DUF6884)
LIGRPLLTVTGRENRILEVDAAGVLVATGRSPTGQWVRISSIDKAVERIEREREIEGSVQSLGYRSAFIGAVLRELPGAEVLRGKSPPRIRLNAKATTPVAPQTVLLLGCVKLKIDQRAPAKDLYCSTLWRGRRAYAEGSGHPWFILSAQHGLVDPDEELAPYDLALTDLSAADRRAWGDQVTEDLEHRMGQLTGVTLRFTRVRPIGGRSSRDFAPPELDSRCRFVGFRSGRSSRGTSRTAREQRPIRRCVVGPLRRMRFGWRCRTSSIRPGESALPIGRPTFPTLIARDCMRGGLTKPAPATYRVVSAIP